VVKDTRARACAEQQLDAVKTEEEAIEAIGSLRELLALEDLTELG
jgi:hypothetical protein